MTTATRCPGRDKPTTPLSYAELDDLCLTCELRRATDADHIEVMDPPTQYPQPCPRWLEVL